MKKVIVMWAHHANKVRKVWKRTMQQVSNLGLVMAFCKLSVLGVLLQGCATTPPVKVSSPSTSSSPSSVLAGAAVAARYTAVDWKHLPGWAQDEWLNVWEAGSQSCRRLSKQVIWQAICAQWPAIPPEQRRAWLMEQLQPYQISTEQGDVDGLITGYFEPVLNGSQLHSTQFRYPLYAVPPDLVQVDLGAVYPSLKGQRVRGRLVGRQLVPYYTRAEIDQPASPLQGFELAWVDDPVALFFLHVQGSGRIRLPDGQWLRVGYADQNGQPYSVLAKYLLEKGEISPAQASMQGIMAWAKQAPAANVLQALNSNPSYVFFRLLPANDQGPIGALGVPLTPERSVAVDPRYIPLGAPLFLSTQLPNGRPLQRLMWAQDTGGAIKGVVRADYFFGLGDAAGAIAGKMKQKGQLWLLWPRGQQPILN